MSAYAPEYLATLPPLQDFAIDDARPMKITISEPE
jgi:hypothetical protein